MPNHGINLESRLLCRITKELLIGEVESTMTKIYQQKFVTEQVDTTSPEHYLWNSVLSKAAHDAIYSSDWREAKLAIAWFKGKGAGFKEVCQYAGRDPNYVYTKMLLPIARREAHMEMTRNGSRLYVKETKKLPTQFHSYYRSMNIIKGPRRKRGRPKGTKIYGNKPKDLRMVLQGKKGGRPRMYDGV